MEKNSIILASTFFSEIGKTLGVFEASCRMSVFWGCTAQDRHPKASPHMNLTDWDCKLLRIKMAGRGTWYLFRCSRCYFVSIEDSCPLGGNKSGGINEAM